MKALKAIGSALIGIAALASTIFLCAYIAGFDIPALNTIANPVREATSMLASGGAQKVDTAPDYSHLPTGDETLALPYYRSLLSEEEQRIYDAMYSGIMEMSDKIDIESTDGEQVNRAFEYMTYDHPEIFWIDGTYEYNYFYDGRIYSFRPHYHIDQADRDAKQAKIDETVAAIVSAIPQDAGEYEKARLAYKTLCEQIEYDIDAVDSQNIVSSLVNGVSSCAGYAKAYQYLLGKIDVPCIYVAGAAAGETGAKPHAWNVVCIDGVMSNVDITWGDGMGNASAVAVDYSYFCLPDVLFSKDHSLDDESAVPDCESADLLYAKTVGSYWDGYDAEAVKSRIYSGLCNGDETVYLQFGGDDAYAECVGDINEAGMLFDSISGAAAALGEDVSQVAQTCLIYRMDGIRCLVVTVDMDGDGAIKAA